LCKLRGCSLAFALLCSIAGCSATQVQETPAPKGEAPPCRACEKESSDSTSEGPALDSTSPASESLTPARTPSDLRAEDLPQTQKTPITTPQIDFSEKPTQGSATSSKNDTDYAQHSSRAETQAEEDLSSTPIVVDATQAHKTPEVIMHYTVKGGENLYTIADQPFIYADGMLWPLIYRANRDQIKDPRQIYPGQALNIPRGISESDKEQARTTAKESAIFAPE